MNKHDPKCNTGSKDGLCGQSYDASWTYVDKNDTNFAENQAPASIPNVDGATSLKNFAFDFFRGVNEARQDPMEFKNRAAFSTMPWL